MNRRISIRAWDSPQVQCVCNKNSLRKEKKKYNKSIIQIGLYTILQCVRSSEEQSLKTNNFIFQRAKSAKKLTKQIYQ